ncbi:NAD(P)-dependent dehydrogenase (short-subunit alcohol dehydrogenase family) [Shimia isoporae]|uniref:NAD(P)-dependent dehydrogenase (Short-subunit alcohol dehydrogenase family) n=1 Tax=Shimia isoporae TaxID=647720 RepID=A0A4R1NNZ9_9RHOB|nr:SDR family oxidoreductase [Shimia isoporae]TCL10177.1 NAD(P)-dependent dehydrogenase (short-subunit alcohol dehydrogenase family) [Shimia isoporae]
MKRALITAGASGVGLAMARAFDREGWRVWIADLDGAALGAAPDTWQKSHVDVSDETAVKSLFDEVLERWGGVDALCANAGIAGPTAVIEDIKLQDWQACVAVNLEGAFLAAKYAAPMMKAQKGGSIVVTSSTAGQYGYPYRAPYAAAKWAVIGLTKTLAMELGPFGVRANVICPGAVEGARMEGVLEREAEAKGMTRDDVYAGYASGTAMGSFIEGRDVAEMAVFLSSENARLVSGQVIAVDGFTVNPDPKV